MRWDVNCMAVAETYRSKGGHETLDDFYAGCGKLKQIPLTVFCFQVASLFILVGSINHITNLCFHVL